MYLPNANQNEFAFDFANQPARPGRMVPEPTPRGGPASPGGEDLEAMQVKARWPACLCLRAGVGPNGRRAPLVLPKGLGNAKPGKYVTELNSEQQKKCTDVYQYNNGLAAPRPLYWGPRSRCQNCKSAP